MIVFLMLLVMLGFSTSHATAAEASQFPRRAEPSHSVGLRTSYAHLPLTFELNRGQTDPQVKFLARGQGYTLFLTASEAVLVLRRNPAPSSQNAVDPQLPSQVLRMSIAGSGQAGTISGEEELKGRSNYFLGKDPRDWHTDIPTYAKVKCANVSPGVDLVYYGHQDQLEHDFVVAPGADLGRVRLRIEGARRREIDRQGSLVLHVEGGEVRFERPQAYQLSGSARHVIQSRYVLRANGEVGFEVSRYDRRMPLVIDPVLVYSTYLGGTGGDVAYGIAVDSAGEAYVTGATGSINFPVVSPEQPAVGGNTDAFITKLNPAGTGLIYSTYLGGAGADSAAGIAIDSSGNVYVAGTTYSTAFPVTSNAFQSTYAGNGDGFIAELGPAGSTLLFASYLGGSNSDLIQGVAIDSSGNAYVTGTTQSTDFPVMNPLQIGNGGDSDAFIAKVNPSGTNLTSLVYSTYLGGSSADYAQAISVDRFGDAYIAGYTYSSDFPTQSAFQSTNAGGVDIFLAELNPTASALVFSTYFGGTGQDRAFGMALDSIGSIYLTGDTQSTDFPTTDNAFQPTNNGQGDAFAARFSPGATGLVFSTLLGGGGADQGDAIALDASGSAYVTGFTQSGDFPLLDPLQKVLGLTGASSCGSIVGVGTGPGAGTCSDAFVALLRSSGQLVYSTYLGGSSADVGQAAAVDPLNRAYVAGSTSSQNFPTIAGAPQGTYAGAGGSTNVFVAKIDIADLPAVALSPQQVNFGNQALNNASTATTVTLVNPGSVPLNISDITASGDFSQTNDCGVTIPAAGGNCTIQVTFTPKIVGTRTDQISISDNAAGSPQQITVTGTGVASSLGAITLTPSNLQFPSEPIGTTSPVQTVLIANTGKSSLTLTNITVSGDFALVTTTCGSLPLAPTSLNAGASCYASISFTPTSAGKQTGALTIQSNAVGSTGTSASLTGNGLAAFTLAASTRSIVLEIGTTYTTFTVSASAPSSFGDLINLSCSSGATCSFNPTTITAGQTSTVTVSGLTGTSDSPVNGVPTPLNFTVTGTSGSQTSNVAVSIFFSDFSVSATPPVNTVTAGQSTSYTVTITPYNSFNYVVLLSCAPNLPPLTICSWGPSAVTLNGTAAVTATLTLTTTTQKTSRFGPRLPPIPGIMSKTGFRLWTVALLALCILASRLANRRKRTRGSPAWIPRSFRLAALSMMLLAVGLGAGCNDYTLGPNITQSSNGTPTGNYGIQIFGTLGNNNNITRTTSVNLSVGPG